MYEIPERTRQRTPTSVKLSPKKLSRKNRLSIGLIAHLLLQSDAFVSSLYYYDAQTLPIGSETATSISLDVGPNSKVTRLEGTRRARTCGNLRGRRSLFRGRWMGEECQSVESFLSSGLECEP